MEVITEREWQQKRQKNSKNNSKVKPGSNWKIIFLLFLIGGLAGWHRFYVGKIGTGILYFFTLGFFLIGYIIDFFCILSGVYTDKNGKYIERP